MKDPGYVAYLTLNLGSRHEKASKLVLTRHGTGQVGWDMPAVPAMGDSAIGIYWPVKELKAGGKRDIAYAYGEGVAITAESEILVKPAKIDGTPPTVMPVIDDKDFVPLFNGKDLTGWKTNPKSPGDWRVEKGLLSGSTDEAGQGLLFTDRENFKDYYLRAEVRSTDGSGGVTVRAKFDAPSPSVTWKSTNPVPAWLKLEVTAQGNQVRVKLDGKEVWAAAVDKEFMSGHIALHPGVKSVTEFRNIEIKEFKSDAAPLVVADAWLKMVADMPEKIITTKSGLKYCDLKLGTGKEAKAGDSVTVNYVGTLNDGKEFDNSVKRNAPFTFPLGQNRVIKGWDEGVVGMKEGGKRILVLPPNLAYGAQGFPPTIPQNAELHFEVELLNVK